MAPLLVFGASRGVGLELARLECSLGRDVTALIRPASDGTALERLGVRVIRGDAFIEGDVAAAFSAAATGAGTDRGIEVVSTLGGTDASGRRADDDGNLMLVRVAVRMAVHRFVLVTSIGCGEMAPYRSQRAIDAFGAAVDAKTRAEDALRASPLAWTLVRPGGLTSGAPTGTGLLVADPQMHGFIDRADVAALVARCLRDPGTARRWFAAVDEARARSDNPVQSFAVAPLPAFAAGATTTLPRKLAQ